MKKESYDFFIYSLSLKLVLEVDQLEKLKSLNNVKDIRTKAGLGKDLEKSC
jgi:hypothetical protein